jgi:hypothetical protein
MLMLLALPQLITLLHSLKLVKKALLQMICLVIAISNANLELLLIIVLLLLEVKTKLFTKSTLLLIILLRGVYKVIFT